MNSLHGLTQEEIKEILSARGEKPFRAGQLLSWLYEKRIDDFSKMSDLGKALRVTCDELFSTRSIKEIERVDSLDGETTKFLWELSDGKLVESVLIYAPDRRTVCVSSQVGCPARCAFCASGKKGLIRNLTAAEIVEQVYWIDQFLRGKNEKVSNVVFMGMGEPFENYDTVTQAIRFLIDPKRFGFSQRRITVSTVGIIDKIYQFSKEDFKVNLVLSLHAPNQRIRQKIIPFARRYSIEGILESMLHYSQETGRDITYEYTLMKDINDKPEDAVELTRLIKGHPCTVNLIPYNPVEGLKLNRPEKEVIEEFRNILVEQGIPTTWRYTKGKDIAAACGQLALRENKLILQSS